MIPLLGEMSAKQTKGCLNSENLPPPSIHIEPRGGGRQRPTCIALYRSTVPTSRRLVRLRIRAKSKTKNLAGRRQNPRVCANRILRVCPRTKKQSTGLSVAHCGAPSCSTPHQGKIQHKNTPSGDGKIPGCVQIALYESARGLTDSPPDCLLRTAVRRPVRLHSRAKSNTKTPRRETTAKSPGVCKSHLTSLPAD